MVKTPRTHSKGQPKSVTIDLEPNRPDLAEATADTSLPTDTDTTAPNSDLQNDPVSIASDEAASTATNEPAADPISEHIKADASEDLVTSAADSEKVAEPELASAEPLQATDDHQPKKDPEPAKPTFAPAPENTSTAKPAPAPAKRGGLSAIAAGIIGGVITLAGAGALQYAGVLPSPATGTSDTSALDTLRAELVSLQSEIASLKAGGAEQNTGELQARIDALGTDLAAVKQAIESGGAGENAGLAALDAKIKEVEAQLATLSQAGSAGAPVDLTPINDRIAALETAVQAATAAASAGDPRLTALEEAVAALTTKLEAQGDQPKIALSIAASALKSAIERGDSFKAELETLAAISPDLPQLAALRAHAEAGVPTREALVAEADGAATAMISAAEPTDANAGFLDQLLNSAASLVTVRPVGAVPGAGVPETVARMEAALKDGDLAKALLEYDALPDAPKAAGAEFAAKIKARLEVETLVDQAIADAMKTI